MLNCRQVRQIIKIIKWSISIDNQANPKHLKKIAIFDDDEDILSICSYVLEERGWQVYTFTNCNGIVERITQIMPDAILMDNWVPDDGGVAATQRLKSNPALAVIPVIYFSANSDIRQLAETAKADSFLAKPFDLDALEEVIQSVLKQ